MKKGLMLIFSTAMISGVSVFLNKYGASAGDPYVFAFLKNTAVALMLSALVLGFKNRAEIKKLAKKDWLTLGLIGLVGGSIPFLLFFKGLSLTSAAQGSFIHKSMFLFIAAGAIFFLKEKLSKNFLIGALMLLTANLFILKTFAFKFGPGDALVLAAVLFWTAENLISKFALNKLSGNVVAWGRMFFGSVIIFSFMALTGRLDLIASVNETQWSWIAVTAVLLLAYNLTWYNGLKTVPVSVASAVLMLGAPVTALLAAVASGKIVPKDAYSGILIVGGLLVILSADWLWRRARAYVRT